MAHERACCDKQPGKFVLIKAPHLGHTHIYIYVETFLTLYIGEDEAIWAEIYLGSALETTGVVREKI